MRIYISILIMLCPCFLSAQTYSTSSQGSNNSAGKAYVAPVVTKTYTTPTPATQPTHYTAPNSAGSNSGSYRNTNPVNAPETKTYGRTAAEQEYLDRDYRPTFDNLFFEGLCWVSVKDRDTKKIKYGYADSSGNIVIPMMYEQVGFFSSGYQWASIKLGGKWGFINIKGAIVLSPQYDEVKLFVEDLLPAMVDGKWGCVDRKGNVIVPFRYEDVLYFSSKEKTAVKLKGKWGYIDINEKVVLPFIYQEIKNAGFKKLDIVKINDKWGIIDSAGKMQVPPKYDFISRFNAQDLAIVYRGEKRGFINENGEEIIPSIYDKVEEFRDGVVRVVLRGKSYYFDKAGNAVLK